jgi:hypothetical protein
VRHSLWWEDGSVIYSYSCFWAFPEQSHSGPSPVELKTVFYCLIWDSPAWKARFPYLYPPGTRWPSYTPSHWVPFSSPLTTCKSKSSYITTDSQSASPSWCQAPDWDPRPIFPHFSLIVFRQLRVYWCGAPSLMRGRVCNLQCSAVSIFRPMVCRPVHLGAGPPMEPMTRF